VPSDYPAGYNAKPEVIGDRYTDDNLWLGEDFMAQYLLTNDEKYLKKVQAVLRIFIRSWEDSGGNGAFWQCQLSTRDASRRPWPFGNENTDRVVVSNAPAIPLLIGMAKLGKDAKDEYTQLAEQTYGWLQATLQDKETGLYFDHISKDGMIDKTLYPYCQAKMIDAIVALNSVDPTKYPLSLAQELFEKSVAHFSTSGDLGKNTSFDAMLVESGMRLALQLENTDFTRLVCEFMDYATKIAVQKAPPVDLLDAAGIVKLKILSGMRYLDWHKLRYTPTA
jgi:uncharacterized protein YyaL (SSP411 family)